MNQQTRAERPASSRPASIARIAAILAALGILFLMIRSCSDGPDGSDFAASGLESLRVQNRLSVMEATFVSVQSKKRTIVIFSAENTLIVPGTVRYEIDMTKFKDGDVRWHADTKTMEVTIPALEISEPQIDLQRMKTIRTGTIARIGDADASLEAATRSAVKQDLKNQANASALRRQARDAAKNAIRANFALPLRAAGIDAKVAVRFADEAGSHDPSQFDRSRPMEEVLKERREQGKP